MLDWLTILPSDLVSEYSSNFHCRGAFPELGMGAHVCSAMSTRPSIWKRGFLLCMNEVTISTGFIRGNIPAN